MMERIQLIVFIPFFLLLSILFLTCLSAITTTDQSALLSLKSRITSDPYNNVMQNWTVTSPVCDWVGVTCGNRHQRVTHLNISYMSLTGEIPPELGNLSFLVSLDMRRNQFFGIIPEDLSRLRRLRYFRINNNGFSGEVPSWFAFLPRLKFLYLSNNSFTSMDSFINSFTNESKLATLDMSFNPFRGKIPESIGNHLRGLKQLGMRGNKLSGSLPSSLSNLTSLVVLLMGNNYIEGSLPEELGNLRNLRILDLESNQLVDSIPSSIFNISTLEVLAFTYNRLSGKLPDDMCVRLPLLRQLYLSVNELHGEIPANMSLCSQLQLIDLSANNFTGNLQAKAGHILPNLERLYLGINNFVGDFPRFILNSSKLTLLDLSDNKLTGSIPSSIGDLRFLQILNLGKNGFTSDSTMSFITSLTNCKYLTVLFLSENPLNGVLPASVGNLSSSLTDLFAFNCGIEGNIPNEIGNLSLVSLNLGSNYLTGEFPRTVRNLVNLQGLSFADNRIKGLIPNELCKLESLGLLYLGNNQLTGPIPECLGTISSLRELNLESNNLTSSIPSSIWDLKDLIELDVSSNSFAGSLSPQVGNLKAAASIDLSMNQFSGDIPSTFGGLTKLINLSLANNNFQGQIPQSMGSMLSLASLDLSHNRLNGTIPKSFEALQYLENFNVSYNELSGEIPTNGSFQNFTSRSFMFNAALCGPSRFNVSSCPKSHHRSKMKKVLRPLLISVGVGAFVFAICLAYAAIRYRRKTTHLVDSDIHPTGQPARFSYYDLLHATENYNEDNLLGKGSFGSVYKGVLRDGTILAVKVFHIQSEGSLKSFEVECEALRNLRHRNLVRVLGSCTNEDFKAIVLEYMQHGCLAKCLYSGNQFLDIVQRLNVMIDVASALEYLHHGASMSVVHCDLKPENVLLDENMVAHVSDFGVTKYLNEGESITCTMTLATLGYMAPEYGSEGRVSTKCDVYSYGIMLLETFTRKRPSDEMFSGDVNLRDWVKSSMPDAIIQVIDANLLSPEEEGNLSERKLHCVLSIMELGLRCSANTPSERMNMKDVCVEMRKIKVQLMASSQSHTK